jgi:hypothetical protein
LNRWKVAHPFPGLVGRGEAVSGGPALLAGPHYPRLTRALTIR